MIKHTYFNPSKMLDEFLSFFLLILARSNYDHYARKCNFGILKKKQQLFIKLQLGRVGMDRVLHLGPSWHGPIFMWAELAWAELVLGRVVLHPVMGLVSVSFLKRYRHGRRHQAR